MTLAAKRILITRPEAQGEGLLKRLRSLGAVAIHYPVLAIVPLTDKALRQQARQKILDLDLYHHVIFISTNAVQYGGDWIDDFWPQLPVGIQWHAIGMTTATAMVKRGLNAAAPTVAMDSEALLALLDLHRLSGQRVLIVRGVGGRDHLAEQLRKHGAKVDYIECYQRQLPERPAGELAHLISDQAIEVICVNSGESLQNLISLVGIEPLLSRTLLVPSQRVAEIAKAQGLSQLQVAVNASDAACVNALQQWAGESPAENN